MSVKRDSRFLQKWLEEKDSNVIFYPSDAKGVSLISMDTTLYARKNSFVVVQDCHKLNSMLQLGFISGI